MDDSSNLFYFNLQMKHAIFVYVICGDTNFMNIIPVTRYVNIATWLEYF